MRTPKLGSLSCFAFLVMIAVSSLVRAQAGQSNPIVVENQQPGSGAWQIPYGSSSDDTNGQIKGYADATSVNKGQSITFRVSVNPAQTYTIDVYRMGWYQGLGGRLMQHIGPLNGVKQPACVPDSNGTIECHWAASYTVATQTTWTSGIYLALLTNAQGFLNYIQFCVRDDTRGAALLVQQNVNTWQAYNDYPNDGTTGKSLYGFNSFGAKTPSPETPGAVKVSFDRPYSNDGTNSGWGNTLLKFELPFVQWLEMSGYDVSYQTDVDTHINPGSLLNHLGVLSLGHDEYWSKPMYDGWVAALNQGVNLGFFGANAIWWQVRFEPSSSGTPNRVMVCYKDANIDPNTDLTLKTSLWKDPPLNRPAQTLVGVMYTNQVLWQQAYDGGQPYVVNNSGNWVYAGSGFNDNNSATGLVYYEADKYFSTFPSPNAVNGTYTLLSHSPFQVNGAGPDYSNSSVYQAPSGAWVFASGTLGWSRGLNNLDGWNVVDSRIQQTTTNILNRFITPTNNFSLAATPSSQTVTQGGSATYQVTVTPTGTFSGQVTLSVSGLPGSATSTFSPNPATNSSTLSVATQTTMPPGTYPLTITGTSGSLTHTTSVTLVVNSVPDFALGASPASRTINPGASTSYSVNITPIAGFTGQVTLSVTSSLPSGVTPTFNPNPATTSSTLSLTTSTNTPTGNYTLTISGTSGNLSHTTTVQLVVATADFALNASPGSRTVAAGGTATYSVTISPIAGFAGQVTFGVTGLPSGASGTFNPNPAATSSTLSVTTSSSTPSGTFNLSINGASGALAHSVQVSITIQPPGVKFDAAVSSNFSWGVTSVTTPALTIGTNSNRAAMIMVAMYENNATNISASLGGVPGTPVAGADTGASAGYRTMIFCVTNPPSGLQTARVSWRNSTDADVGVISVSGADQTTPCNNGTFMATGQDPNATGTITITANTGDLTATVALAGGQFVSPFTNQTLKWGIDDSGAGGDIGQGLGNTTHTWTDMWPNQTFVISGASFKASLTP